MRCNFRVIGQELLPFHPLPHVLVPWGRACFATSMPELLRNLNAILITAQIAGMSPMKPQTTTPA
jgi:hypothetical protein